MNTETNHIQLAKAAYLEPEHHHFNLAWQATFFMVSLLMITLVFWGLDTRQLDGVSIWAKPLKFELSLAIYFITLALLASFLPVVMRRSRGWRWSTYLAVSAGLFEIIYIVLQAARGRASHFNNDTPVESIMYAMMGVGAVILVAVSFYLGWLFYRDYRHQPTGKLALFKLAAAWGLMLGSVLTLFTAGIMSGSQSHFAGTPAADAWRLPMVGWSLSGGDLRIPHFFATHLMQFLPLYGWWLQRQGPESDIAAGQKKIGVFAAVYTLLVLGGFGISYFL